MAEALAYLSVLLAAATPWLEVALVVPAGILAGLPPGPTVVVAVAGNVLTILPLLVLGDRIRLRLRRGQPATPPSPRRGRARRLLARYGLPGLALLGPVVTGAHLAAVAAVSAGASRPRTLVWLTGGIALWAVAAAALTVAGIETWLTRDRLPTLPYLGSGGTGVARAR